MSNIVESLYRITESNNSIEDDIKSDKELVDKVHDTLLDLFDKYDVAYLQRVELDNCIETLLDYIDSAMED